jgi:DNA-binding MarR family transcriptional regulator
MNDQDKFDGAFDLLLHLSVVLNEDLQQGLTQHGLTVSRAPVIWHLRHGAVTQRELADALNVSARNITGLVDKLEETGFVRREPHPQDRRATLVCLTEQGDAVTREWEREQKDLTRMLFGDMPADKLDCLVEGLAEVLAKVQAAVAAAKEGATP